MKRRFSSSERAVLYLAADGKCSDCGSELTDGWHADHVHPYSKGGATDVVNGQALCASCNITKGDKHSMAQPTLRKWQQEATRRYFEKDQRNFLAAVTPGAGKTRFALDLAKQLLDEGSIRRIVVIVPSDSLRSQWAGQADVKDLHLRPLEDTLIDKPGYHGTVTTYQALGNERSNTAALYRHRIGIDDPSGTLVILDEIHHAATSGGFGSGLDVAFKGAQRRLLLTGTPWRTDNRERIPYVSYADDGMLQVDYQYTYGDGLRDGVVRPVQFPAIGARVEWAYEGEEYKADMSVDKALRGRDESPAMLTALDPSPSGQWISDVIRRAHHELMTLRQTTPDAGGLIVARNKRHARQIAERLRKVTGVQAPVVVSAEDDGESNDEARSQIKRFRKSRDPWIIAVKMIAEGVDIKRLAVGIYATNVSTELFFSQVVGRFVRTRPGEDVVAQVFIPPSRNLWAVAREMEETVARYIDLSTHCFGPTGPDDPDRPDWPPPPPPKGDFVPLGSESYGDTLVQTRYGIAGGTQTEAWGSVFEAIGVPQPSVYAASAAAKGYEPPTIPSAQEQDDDEFVPRYEQEGLKRQAVNSAVKSLARRRYGRADGESIRRVNNEFLYGPFDKGVGKMDLDELDLVLARINSARTGTTV